MINLNHVSQGRENICNRQNPAPSNGIRGTNGVLNDLKYNHFHRFNMDYKYGTVQRHLRNYYLKAIFKEYVVKRIINFKQINVIEIKNRVVSLNTTNFNG